MLILNQIDPKTTMILLIIGITTAIYISNIVEMTILGQRKSTGKLLLSPERMIETLRQG